VVIHERAELLAKKENYREAFDIVVSRAVARLNILAELCLPFVAVGGVFMAMKGPDLKEEQDEAAGAIEILGGGRVSSFEYNLPQIELRRSIVSINKAGTTPEKYPRGYARIQKTPL
jgi:16S rRNA (guanine527-N7)-methyltransferase